jgi:hypothetical protein
MVNVILPLKNMNHPPVVGSYRLDKIFGGIPAGSSLPAGPGPDRGRGRQGISPTHQ